MRARTLSLCFLALVALVGPAFAQAPPAIDEQRFKPSPHPNDILAVRTAFTPDEGAFGFGLLLNFASGSLEFSAGDVSQNAVASKLVADLMVSATPFDFLDVAVALPIHLYVDGDEGPLVAASGMAVAGLGDLRLSPKFRILGGREGFGLAVEPELIAPTGADEHFMREDGLVFFPRLVLDYALMDTELRFALNIAYKWRTSGQQDLFFANPANPTAPPRKVISVGDEIWFGLGVDAPIYRKSVDALIEIEAASDTGDFFGEEATQYMELRGAVRYTSLGGISAVLGAGGGLLYGLGAPQWRIFAGVAYSPREVAYDEDRDGVPNDRDQCLLVPEDPDGYQDDDGCPEEDNDGDGIDDISDACPDQREDPDGFEDSDGCPDLDNDGDAVRDENDRCPLEPEDPDGYEDEDGCPDPDNDGDGIPDSADRCPGEPENVNGCEDTDGCPESGQVCVEEGKITISEKIHFNTGRATIRPESFPILEALAQTLTQHPEVLKVRVEGHTDNRGSASRNLKLSRQRADAVLEFLVAQGVAPDRLVAEGYGDTQPLEDNRTAAGRKANRRVAFTILEREGDEEEPSEGEPTPEDEPPADLEIPVVE